MTNYDQWSVNKNGVYAPFTLPPWQARSERKRASGLLDVGRSTGVGGHKFSGAAKPASSGSLFSGAAKPTSLEHGQRASEASTLFMFDDDC